MNKVYISHKLREVEEYEKGIDRRLKKLGEYIERKIRKFKVMDFIPRGRVVDFGAGIGLDLISLSRLCDGIELVGVDISFKGLKKAKELMSKEGKEFHLVRADVLFPPFRDKVFDAVNFSSVLHHHPFGLLKRIMVEVDRISKKNSSMLVSEPSDPNESYEFSWEINRIWNGVKDLEKLSSIYNLKDLRKIGYDLHVLGYYGYIYPSILKRLLEKHGFKITKMKFMSESLRIDEVIEELKKKVKSLSLDESVKDYLIDRLVDIKRKYALISPLYNFQLYVKAVRK